MPVGHIADLRHELLKNIGHIRSGWQAREETANGAFGKECLQVSQKTRIKKQHKICISLLY